MAALAAIVDHDHARALNELLRESIQLRQQLERQRQQLERQRHQLHHQELLIAELQIKRNHQERHIAQLEVTISSARHDVQMGRIESAARRLGQFVDYADDASDASQ